MAFFVYGIHMATSAFFQGIGQPTKALIIPLVRQGIVLIPLGTASVRPGSAWTAHCWPFPWPIWQPS